MARDFLVVDMQRVLDESQVGKDAAAALEGQMKAAQEEFRKLGEKAKAATGADKTKAEQATTQFEAKALGDLDTRRRELREELVARARPIMAGLAMKEGAKLVLERSAVIIFDSNGDITNEVITKVDAAGPLKGMAKK